MRGPGYDGAYPARLVVRAAATGVTTGALRAATRSRRRPRPRAARLRRTVRFVAHTGPPDRYDPRVPNCRDGTLDFDADLPDVRLCGTRFFILALPPRYT